MIVPVNYWAVLVAAIAAFVIGFLWYGPLFGKFWMRLRGKDPATKGQGPMPMTPMVVQFVASLVVAFFIAEFAAWVGGGLAIGIVGTTLLAFWIWLGFLATEMVGNTLWGGESWTLYFFNIAQRLVGFLVMAAIIGAWQ